MEVTIILTIICKYFVPRLFHFLWPGNVIVLNIEFVTLELPSITRQPVSVAEEKSRSATFYVSVRGYSPFRYQWYHNYRTMADKNGRYLYINNLNVNNSGSYYCRICNPDNRCITSYTVQLTVTG